MWIWTASIVYFQKNWKSIFIVGIEYEFNAVSATEYKKTEKQKQKQEKETIANVHRI